MTDETPEPEAPQQEASRETDRIRIALVGAYNALRSYQYGNESPDLAKTIADHTLTIIESWTQQEAPTQPEPEPINYVTTNPYCRGMGTQTDPGRP